MKTAATPLRSLLLTLGALAAIVAVAWSVNARPQAAETVAGDHLAPQSAADVAPAPLAAVEAPVPASPVVVTEAPVEAGLKAYVDPETGGLTSVPPQTEALPLAGAQLVRPDRLPEITLEDGSVMVRLDERFEESVVMTLDANGRRVMTCTQHPGEAHAHAAQPAVTREVE